LESQVVGGSWRDKCSRKIEARSQESEVRIESAPAVEAEKNIQDRHEHVKKAGEQHQRAGDGAVGERIVEHLAGSVHQDADAQDADSGGDQNSRWSGEFVGESVGVKCGPIGWI
jgi:hypothetical protein